MTKEPLPTDAEIVAGCQRGNGKYQEILYKKYYTKMLGVCLRYTENREDAKDILQDGFMKAFTHINQLADIVSVQAWLRKIMVNTAIDFIRMKKRLVFSDDKISVLENVKDNTNIFSDMSAEDILKYINKLPAGKKVVFNLFAIEGYSHKEIGSMTGITESTSKSQYLKARLALQEMLQQHKTEIHHG